MEKAELNGVEWLDPEKYLKALDLDLYNKLRSELDSESEEPCILDKVWELRQFSLSMVRYSLSDNPLDRMAINSVQNKALINPDTKLPFTFEDIGIDRQLCLGPTTGVVGREEMVARVELALLRKIGDQDLNITSI